MKVENLKKVGDILKGTLESITKIEGVQVKKDSNGKVILSDEEQSIDFEIVLKTTLEVMEGLKGE